MAWTINEIQEKLNEIEQKGFIGIPETMFRTDDGVVGQILEREFSVKEK